MLKLKYKKGSFVIIMGHLGDFCEKTKAIFPTIFEKTTEVFNISKLRVEAADLKLKIKKMCERLGLAIYENNKLQRNNQEEIDLCLDSLTNLFKELSRKKKEINLRQNVKVCCFCFNKNKTDSKYCSNCGYEFEGCEYKKNVNKNTENNGSKSKVKEEKEEGEPVGEVLMKNKKIEGSLGGLKDENHENLSADDSDVSSRG